MKLAVVCADARMECVADDLARDFCVDRLDEHTDFLALPSYQAIVFPVKGPDSFGYCKLHDQQVHIPQRFYELLDKDTLLFCGLPNAQLACCHQPKCYYMQEEDVINGNAILTAEGVLNQLIGCIEKSLYDIQVDIVGYGHCGSVIYEMLKNLHVKVRVIRRTCEEDGDFVPLAKWKDCGDVIIHTAIAPMIDAAHIQAWSRKPVILDIATPDVIDHLACEQRGIRIIKAGNLPGRFACISAGRIIADCVRGKVTHGK